MSCFPCPHVVFAIGSSVLCVMFSLVVIVSCLHWLFLVMCLSVFVISSHVLAFSACRVLMLLPAVGESSPFMSCQVCLLSSLIMFGFHLLNKLHLGSHYARLQWTHYRCSLTCALLVNPLQKCPRPSVLFWYCALVLICPLMYCDQSDKDVTLFTCGVFP